MTIEQAVLKQLRTLPPEAQQEVLDFVEFLVSRHPKTTNSTTLLEAESDLIGAIPDLPSDLSMKRSS
ncbi:MAG: DUF2281 domain-containing protein [Leptolyngbya sp. Prado105]|jgi:hypothetical protein|nr:DUF2281 domain-containing protein [Leptolyngbya sp. Prado105]